MIGDCRRPLSERTRRCAWCLSIVTLLCGPGGLEAGDETERERPTVVAIESEAIDVADEAVTAGEPSRVRATGDILLRFETVRDAPNPLTSDFQRLRLRLRPGIEVSLGRRLWAGAGLGASLSSDTNEDNPIRIDNFVSDEMTIDRVYLGISMGRSPFSGTLGVFTAPFTGTEVLWDRDIRFHGATVGGELPSIGGLVAQRLYGGISVGSQNAEDESRTAAVRWEAETARGFSFGAGFWYFDETEALVGAGYARTNRLAPGGEDFLSDFEIANITVGWETFGPRRPVHLRLDLLYNVGADDRRSGFDLRVDWGEVQPHRGSWRLRLMLQRVEQDAALAAFGGDEWWFRTEQRGARLGLAVALGPRVVIEFSALRQRRDRLDEWLDRGWLDMVVFL